MLNILFRFLAEETSNENNLTNDPTWIIDPIDGTVNYVHKFPFFGINIGFSLNKELQFGATYLPKLDELYTARKGQGAYLNGERIHVSVVQNVILKIVLCIHLNEKLILIFVFSSYQKQWLVMKLVCNFQNQLLIKLLKD